MLSGCWYCSNAWGGTGGNVSIELKSNFTDSVTVDYCVQEWATHVYWCGETHRVIRDKSRAINPWPSTCLTVYASERNPRVIVTYRGRSVVYHAIRGKALIDIAHFWMTNG